MECNHVEEYRQPWESDEHWAKRKEFILKYWNQFKEYTLLCLAQVYADVELHGWSYPIPTLRYVRILPPDAPEGTNTPDAQGGDAVKLLEKEEQEISPNPGSSSGGSPQKRTKSEVSDTNSEENDSELSSPSRKKLKLLDLTVPSDANSSETSVANERCNFTASCNVYEESPNGDNEESGFVSLTTMQKSGIKDFQCETSVEDELRQNPLQTVQESDVSLGNSTDQAMDTEPITSGNIFSGNMNKLESLCSESLCDSGIQFDPMAQILDGDTTLHNNLSDSELNSLHIESSRDPRVLQSVPKSSAIRTDNSSLQNSNVNKVTLENTCDSTYKGEIKQNSIGMVEQESVKNAYATDATTTRQKSTQGVIHKADSTTSEKCIRTMSDFDTLPKSLKDNFTDILHFIWKLRTEQFSASEMLEHISKRYNLRLECHSEECPEKNDGYECSLEIDGVLISKGKAPTKKGAYRQAGRLAFDRLMVLSTEADSAKSDYYDRPSTSFCSKILNEPEPDPPFIDLCDDTKYNTSDICRDVCLLNTDYSSQNACGEVTQNSSEKIAPSLDLTCIGNFCGIDNLPENLKDKFIQGAEFIITSLAKRLNPVVIINNLSSKFRIKIKFDTREVKKEHYLSYECSLQVDTFLISKAEGRDIKNARFCAARIAIDELMEFLKREGYPFPIEEINSCKKRMRKNKKLNSGVAECSRNTILPNTHIVFENSDVDSCKNASFPLKPLNSNSIVLSYDEQISGFIPLSSAGQKKSQRAKRKERNSRKERNGRKKPISKKMKVFVILDYSEVTKMDCFAQTLILSANYSNVQCTFKYDEINEGSQQGDKFRVQISINGKAVCSASGKTKKKAREAAAKEALDLLKATAYTVKVKYDDFVIKPDNLSSLNPAELDALPESNIGYKMLKIMGWTGGGLGRPENRGIAEPIEAKGQAKVKRGLGFPEKEKENDSKRFVPLVEKTIKDYINQSPTSNLIFSSEFRPWQRKIIQRLAKKHSLWFKCFSTNNSKYAIVSMFTNAKQFVNNILLDEGRTCKYELTAPSE